MALYGTVLCRDLTSGKLPKDGYLLGDMELRQIVEAFAEDNAIFLAVGASSTHKCSSVRMLLVLGELPLPRGIAPLTFLDAP